MQADSPAMEGLTKMLFGLLNGEGGMLKEVKDHPNELRKIPAEKPIFPHLTDEDFIKQSKFHLPKEIFLLLVEKHPVPVLLVNNAFELLYANIAAETLFGKPRGEIVGRFLNDLIALENCAVLDNSGSQVFIKNLCFGRTISLDIQPLPYKNENKKITAIFLGLKTDLEKSVIDKAGVNESAAKATMGSNEGLDLFENSPTPQIEQNLSEVKKCADWLVANNILDFSTYFKNHPAIFKECQNKVRTLRANKSALVLFGARELKEVREKFNRPTTESSRKLFEAQLESLARDKREFKGETWERTIAGEPICIDLKWTACKDDFSKVILSLNNNTEIKWTEESMQRLAFYDSLTGLPNRRLLKDRLGQALATANRKKLMLGVLFIDLDGFKKINDVYSHSTGDLLLLAVTMRLTDAVRHMDIIARYGGDEFLVVLPEISSRGGAARVAQKIITKLNEPFDIGNGLVSITCSIGVSLFPGDGNKPETLITRADEALHKAKSGGKNKYLFYDMDETKPDACK